MATDSSKPVKTGSRKPATKIAAGARAKPVVAQPASRTRAAGAASPAAKKPAVKRAPAAARTATTTAKKTVARAPVARKSPATRISAHEPEPFVAKDDNGVKSPKVKKVKLVRDSFTMPEGEYLMLAALKKRCLDSGVAVKKSEILRAAVANMAKLSDAAVVAAVRRLDIIKTGRPAKGK
ncbi:MAG: hypothetical protein ACYCY9_12370 [Thiobacillus sp.]